MDLPFTISKIVFVDNKGKYGEKIKKHLKKYNSKR